MEIETIIESSGKFWRPVNAWPDKTPFPEHAIGGVVKIYSSGLADFELDGIIEQIAARDDIFAIGDMVCGYLFKKSQYIIAANPLTTSIKFGSHQRSHKFVSQKTIITNSKQTIL